MFKQNQKMTKSMLSATLLAALFASMNLKVAHATTLQETQSKAGRSTELAVPEDFNFDNYQRVRLDVSITDDLNMPMADQILQFYAIDGVEIDDSGEENLKLSLVALAKSDSAGWLSHYLELPSHVTEVLVKRPDMAMDNARRIDLQQQGEIIISF